jgi:hypothetical protein
VTVVVMGAVAAVAYLSFSALSDDSASAGQELTVRYSYAVKWLCGGATESAPWWETDIHVHNPSARTTMFTKKKVEIDFGNQIPRAPGLRELETLDSDWALRMNCKDIFALGEPFGAGVSPGPPWADILPQTDGWIIIESPKKLDVAVVIAAQTNASPTPNGMTVELEYIKPQRIYRTVNYVDNLPGG